MADDTSIRVRPPGDVWQTLPAIPETLQATSNEWGPDRCTFDIRRNPARGATFLAAWTPVDVAIGGVLCWSGRIKETPARSDDKTISIECEGWQYHLDEYAYRRVYVHDRIADWRDARSFLGQNLNPATNGTLAAGQVQADGVITLSFPNGTVLPAATCKTGVILDLGPGLAQAKRVIVTYDSSNNDTSNLVLRAGDADNLGASVDANFVSATNNAGAAGTLAVTFNTARRYVQIWLENDNTSRTLANDVWFRIKTIKVFSATAYESGGASVLTADTIIKDALAQGTSQISTDTSGIDAHAFPIPYFAALDYVTAREQLQAANALCNNILKLDPEARVIFKARPSAAIYKVGSWSGYEFTESSLNNGDDVYDQVAVTGQAADNSRSATEIARTVQLLARISGTFHRRPALPVSATLTTAVATQIANKWLDAHATSALKGELAVTGGGAVRGQAGESLHPAWLLRGIGERVQIDDQIDPDTGGIGRTGTIASVAYSQADRKATLGLDNSRKTFEAQLARYGLLLASTPQA